MVHDCLPAPPSITVGVGSWQSTCPAAIRGSEASPAQDCQEEDDRWQDLEESSEDAEGSQSSSAHNEDKVKASHAEETLLSSVLQNKEESEDRIEESRKQEENEGNNVEAAAPEQPKKECTGEGLYIPNRNNLPEQTVQNSLSIQIIILVNQVSYGTRFLNVVLQLICIDV